MAWVLPALYVVGAVPVWRAFATAPPDGLANLGLLLYTYPVAFVGTMLLGLEFPYVPGSYYGSHTVYFVVAVALTAGLLFLGLHLLSRLLQRLLAAARKGSGEPRP